MGDKPILPVLVGPFSGPVQGVSIIGNALRAVMESRGLTPAVIDLSPGWRARGLSYHAVRAARTACGLAGIFGAVLTGSRRRYVMNLDGGAGLIYNIALTLALRLTGQPVLFYHHSSQYVLKDSALMRLLLRLAGKTPQVFCSEKMARQFLQRYGVQGETLIINNAAWVPPAPDRAVRVADGRLRLGFLSALSLEKGLGRAIETLRTLRRRGLAAELALAGAVSDPQVQALVAQAQQEFGGALTMHGVLHGRDKTDFLSSLDYFLFPSLYPHETQSLVVPEALSAGVPVIAFDHRFVGEVLGDGGLLVPPGENFSIAAADWIITGQGAEDARRRRARGQFEAGRREAVGQVDHLIAWSLGAE
jgi:glycosyltransferase involved in cell wall biosynthesis